MMHRLPQLVVIFLLLAAETYQFKGDPMTKTDVVTNIVVERLTYVVLQWLEVPAKAVLKEVQQALHELFLTKELDGWKEIVKIGEVRLDDGMQALQEAKKIIMNFCHENREEIKQLTKFAVKTTAKQVISKTATKLVIKKFAAEGTKEGAKMGTVHVVKIGVKETVIAGSRMGGKSIVKAGIKETTIVGTKNVVKAGAKQTASLGTKGLIKSAANPLGIASDLAQAGLEFAGYKEEGKMVGKCGNIVSGAMMGGVIAGPAGAAVGAFAGFALWGVGEVVGGIVDRAFGE